MSTSLLYHTQKAYDFQHVSFSYSNDRLLWTIIRSPTKFRCSNCNSTHVTATRTGIRDIKGLPMGCKKTLLRVMMHRLKCHNCKVYRAEKLNFIPRQKCHYTKALAGYVIRIRSEMTIKAVAKEVGLLWDTVKDIEKSHLKNKYRHIPLQNVKSIGIDEVYTGKKRFLTIVRNMDNGDVLFVGDGKSGESLAPFKQRLKNIGNQIESVAIDLGAPYTAWVKGSLPNATIVYDKFHVVKLMNDKLNAIRRRTMNELDKNEKQALKGHRFTMLRNEENLSLATHEELMVIRSTYEELGMASLMKECLRNVYMIAEWEEHARIGFLRWIDLAVETGIKELKTMAKTIKSKLQGIVAYWKGKLTSASMEGFNNKIGWLNRQAYGYRDLEYFKLKIYDLPKIRTTKKL